MANSLLTMLETIGNLIIMLAIIGSGILFVWANANYLPDSDTPESDASSEDDHD